MDGTDPKAWLLRQWRKLLRRWPWTSKRRFRRTARWLMARYAATVARHRTNLDAAWELSRRERAMSDTATPDTPFIARPLRRVRRLMVPEHHVLEMFINGTSQRPPGYIRVLDALPLPAGARVLGVHHDWFSRCFGFVLEHESFEEVPEGAMAPEVPLAGNLTYRAVRVVDESADPPVWAGE